MLGIAIITNHQTIPGFEIAGVMNDITNDTIYVLGLDVTKQELLNIFRSLINRNDLGIILISDGYANIIESEIKQYENNHPYVKIIPTRL